MRARLPFVTCLCGSRRGSGLKEYVASDAAPDPQDVATVIADLIESSGSRPLRTVVDPLGEGIRRINETAATVQHQVMESAGLGKLIR